MWIKLHTWNSFRYLPRRIYGLHHNSFLVSCVIHTYCISSRVHTLWDISEFIGWHHKHVAFELCNSKISRFLNIRCIDNRHCYIKDYLLTSHLHELPMQAAILHRWRIILHGLLWRHILRRHACNRVIPNGSDSQNTSSDHSTIHHTWLSCRLLLFLGK